MNLLIFLMNQAYAVSYGTTPVATNSPVQFTSLPNLVNVEGVLFFILFLLIARPLLRRQFDEKLEQERQVILKLSALVGGAAIIIRLFRLVSGN